VDTTVGGLCLPMAQLCDDRTTFVFWDAYHTSDATNQVIADCLYADMVSAGAVQGNGNVTTASTRAPRVIVDRAASKALKYRQQINRPLCAGTTPSPIRYDGDE
jgi:hypothetical protein